MCACWCGCLRLCVIGAVCEYVIVLVFDSGCVFCDCVYVRLCVVVVACYCGCL